MSDSRSRREWHVVTAIWNEPDQVFPGHTRLNGRQRVCAAAERAEEIAGRWRHYGACGSMPDTYNSFRVTVRSVWK